MKKDETFTPAQRCQKGVRNLWQIRATPLSGRQPFHVELSDFWPKSSTQPEIPAHISRHLLDDSNEFCNMWLTQGSRLYSDIIMAHSVAHEKVQRPLIPPQKAELQSSLFHVAAQEALCVMAQESAGQKGLQLQVRNPRGERLCAG